MNCPHGINLMNHRCDRCEEVAEAEHRHREEFDRLTETPAARNKKRALALIQQAKGYAHCNCPPNEQTGRVDYHSNCQRHLMPILSELEGLIR